jgi:tetratricopeptide (TPR) repeat protein
VLFLVLIVATGAIISNALSAVFENSNPERALSINPLNLDARKALLHREIQTVDGQLTLDELAEMVESSVVLEGHDSLLLGYLGEIRSRQGDELQAQRLFEYSLKLNDTEFWPLLRRFFYELPTGNNIRAFEFAEVIYRRWWQYRSRVVMFLPQILQDPAAFDIALRRLPSFPNGAGEVLSGLAARPNGADIAYRLAVEWHEQGIEDLQPAMNSLVGALLRTGRIDQARDLFQFTLDTEGAKEIGNVFNSRFRLPPGGSPFDWTLGDMQGVGMKRIALDDGEHALAVRFLDTPVQFDKDLQAIFVTPGRFRLQVAYSSVKLLTPKPVILSVRCGRKQIAGVELTPTEEARTVSADFDIPEDCKRQNISIFNEKIVESWRNRYAGSLLIYEVSIVPISS